MISKSNPAVGKSIGLQLAIAGLVAAPLMLAGVEGSHFSIVTAAQAQQGGGHGQGGPSGAGGGQGKGGGAGAAAAGGGAGGGIKVPSTSTSKMGRLNMARALVSPGFDINNVDDPLAPIAQVNLAVTLLSSPMTSTDEVTAAGTAIGTAATVTPVTADTVSKMMDLAGATLDPSWSDSLAAVAEVATQTIADRRTEEGE